MATFNELQSSNVRKSLLLIGVMVGLLAAAGWAIGTAFFGGTAHGPIWGLSIAGGIAIFQALISWFSGADIVLAVHRAKEIGPDSNEYRQVWNLVEEMRIASGLPMPRVYIIPDQSPNAFATGRNPKDGRVAVTTGLLQILDREELQGVIAHELAHIKNRDILFQTIVGVMVGALLILSDIALHSLFWGGGNSNNREGGGHAQLIMFIVAIVFIIISPFLAQMVQFAVSRQREYLADATGAEFTRNPEGLARALAKISNTPYPLATANRGTAHMFISPVSMNAKGKGASSLFSTHPPAEERINRLLKLGSRG